MAVYVVTGKLGGGKTLAAVSKINDAVGRGLKVATNLDLRPVELPNVSRKTKQLSITRLPDRPSVDDIQALGFGIKGVNSLAEARQAYDENNFGLLVLDECGTWLNSRDWQADGRRELINFLLHIRKHLWHVYLIIQDISLLDKQARKSLAEHVVYCRRIDRLSIPFLSTFAKLLGFERLPAPRVHMAVVKYGDQPTSPTVNRWWYRGDNLYQAYDTTQVFTEFWEHGLFMHLPPWHQYSRTFTTWNLKNVMRLTKIYLRKWSRPAFLAAAFFATFLGAKMGMPEPAPTLIETAQAAEPLPMFSAPSSEPDDDESPLLTRLRVQSVFDIGRGAEVTFTDGQREYTIPDLQAQGLTVSPVRRGRFRVASSDSYRVLAWLQ